MEQKKAVLFDYDGVLADTVNDNFLALSYAFKLYEVTIRKNDYMPLEGLSLPRIVEKIGTHYRVKSIFFPEIVKQKENEYKKHNQFRIYDGIEEIILMLKKEGIKLAVVSGASKERLFSVTNDSFLEKFDTIITGDSVKNPKPHPEPYTTALSVLSVTNKQAIVIENAPLGIESAKNAKIFCIAITSTMGKKYLVKADMIVDTVTDLHAQLERVVGQ